MIELLLSNHNCNSCSKVFQGPEISGDDYGRYLLYSYHGEYCLVDCIGDANSEVDAMFQEIVTYLRGISMQTGLVDQHDLVRSCIGVICDCSEKGNAYYYDKNLVEGRTCPHCGSNQTDVVEILKETTEVPYATFSEWRHLTEQQKSNILHRYAKIKIKAWEKQKES